MANKKIGDLIRRRAQSLSFEFFPPKDEAGEAQLFDTIGRLEQFNPTFVSVTYGAGGSTSKNTMKTVLRIQKETKIIPMPHMTCVDQNKLELRKMLEDYKKRGVNNVLALRGDPPKGTDTFVPLKEGFCYAIDLVTLAASAGDFSIGVAVYPEGHIESPSLELDMFHTKQKIDAGADFAISQMFFDNNVFYDFLERADKAGIDIPIIPGIMPIMDIKRIQKFSRACKTYLPDDIVKKFGDSSSEDMKKIGIELATEQCADLLKNNVNYFHFYTLNRSEAVTQIINNLGLYRLGLAKIAQQP